MYRNNSIFYRIYRYFTFKSLFDFDNKPPDTKKWEEFLQSFPVPSDDFELSYNRYKCRMYYFNRIYKFSAQLFSAAALLYYIPAYIWSSRKNNFVSEQVHGVDAGGCLIVRAANVDYKDIIPGQLNEKYGEIIENRAYPTASQCFLNRSAWRIFWTAMRRYPFSFHLNFLILRELAIYSYFCQTYNSKAIAVYVNERNVAMPLVSLMCERRCVDLVSFMHGDYLWQLLHGFMRFTKFYIWDEHYRDLFSKDLRCPDSQMRVYRPRKFECMYEKRENEEDYEYFITYYFGGESVNRIRRVADAFKIFKSRGKKCKVRPHPRRSNYVEIHKAFAEFTIEDTTNLPLYQSIDSTLHVAALSSTVIAEAYYGGKSIVLDDYSEPDRYIDMINRKYIFLKKPHLLLSELLET